MPGTDRPASIGPPLARQLTIIGWLFLGGEFGFILFQLDRVRGVDGSRFATAWGQRIEVLSFIVLPPNLVVLAPAALLAALTVWLVGGQRSAWLDMLLRIVAGIAITLAFVGLAAIVEIATRDGDLELDSIFLRLGGMSIAIGIAWLCRTVDRPPLRVGDG